MVNKKMHGNGIYYYSDGDKYDGEWKYDKKSGKGVYYYNNDYKYDGEWNNDNKHGKGIYYFNNGNIRRRMEKWKKIRKRKI